MSQFEPIHVTIRAVHNGQEWEHTETAGTREIAEIVGAESIHADPSIVSVIVAALATKATKPLAAKIFSQGLWS